MGPKTRIEVVTEGILARRLQDDPSLDGVGLIIFDEFHLRNLDADLALALALSGRELLREAMKQMNNATADLKWLEKAAEAGHGEAQWLLANRYQEGRSTFLWPGSREEAVDKWFKASAESGYPPGMMSHVARLYEHGDSHSERLKPTLMHLTLTRTGVSIRPPRFHHGISSVLLTGA